MIREALTWGLDTKVGVGAKDLWDRTLGQVYDADSTVESHAAYFGLLPVTIPLELMAGLTTEQSFKYKVFSGIATYLFVPIAYKLNAKSRELFGITQDSSLLKKGVHDAVHLFAWLLPLKPTLYQLAGAEVDSAWYATAAVSAMGGLAFYGVDIFKFLMGSEVNRGMPEWVENMTEDARRVLGNRVVIWSAVSTAAVYGCLVMDNFIPVN